MQHRLVAGFWHSGTAYWSHLQGTRRLFILTAWSLKMAPISCPITLVTNYRPMPCNIPEQQRPQTSYEFRKVFSGKKTHFGVNKMLNLKHLHCCEVTISIGFQVSNLDPPVTTWVQQCLQTEMQPVCPFSPPDRAFLCCKQMNGIATNNLHKHLSTASKKTSCILQAGQRH
jgi:hypothetical protein